MPEKSEILFYYFRKGYRDVIQLYIRIKYTYVHTSNKKLGIPFYYFTNSPTFI